MTSKERIELVNQEIKTIRGVIARLQELPNEAGSGSAIDRLFEASHWLMQDKEDVTSGPTLNNYED